MQGDDTSKQKHNRLSELDAMRGIAALCVVLYHFNCRYVEYNPAVGHLPALFGWGHIGVQIFFAISGFVISMTLARTDSVASFARARITRLFPAYWAAMAVTITVVGLGGPEKLIVSPHDALINATMLHYWIDVKGVDGSYWTLSIELGFYCVMALLLRFRLLDKIEGVLVVWLALHILFITLNPFSVLVSRMLAVEHIPLFAIGMIHYRYYRGLIDWRRAAVWHLGLIAIAALSGLWAAILAAGIIAAFWAMTNGLLRFITHPILLWLGAISYPLYLVHQYVGYVLIDQMTGAGLSLFVATFTALVIVTSVAYLLHIFIEAPALRAARGVRRPQLVPAE
jgi:peptidoglycan/LPS O-acetylase OafA/YrhL